VRRSVPPVPCHLTRATTKTEPDGAKKLSAVRVIRESGFSGRGRGPPFRGVGEDLGKGKVVVGEKGGTGQIGWISLARVSVVPAPRSMSGPAMYRPETAGEFHVLPVWAMEKPEQQKHKEVRPSNAQNTSLAGGPPCYFCRTLSRPRVCWKWGKGKNGKEEKRTRQLSKAGTVFSLKC